MTQLATSTEFREHISEIYYFLNFFSQTQLERLEQVPVEFTPCWVEVPQVYCNVHNSMTFLCFIFIGRLNSAYCFSSPNEELKSILFYEILALMDLITEHLESNLRFVLSVKQEEDYPHNAWLVVSRLCKIALSFESWSKYEIDELSFDYFLNKYAYPFDPIVD